MFTSDIVEKRHDGVMWIDDTERNTELTDLDVTHGIQTWDGSKCQWFENHKVRSNRYELQGGVKGSEPHILYLKMFFSAIGLRQVRIDLPWSLWIKQMLLNGAHAAVSQGIQNGEPCVTLVVVPGPNQSPDQYTFTFLPGKDFITRDFRNDTVSGPTAGKFTDSFDVVQMKQFDGLWMPVETSGAINSPQTTNSVKDTLTAFSLTPPSDEEMKLSFPVGTRVIDSINMKSFIVRPDGKREYQAYLDSATGLLISPATQPSAP